MLTDVNLPYVTLPSGGSKYMAEDGGLRLAFYYDLGGVRQKRKIVSAKTMEKLKERAVEFLREQSENYIRTKKQKEAVMEIEKQPVIKTFAEVGAEWYEEYGKRRFAKKKPISFSSYESRGYSLKKINGYIGDVNITDITKEMAEELIDKCSVKKDGTYYSRSAVDKLQQVFQLVMKYGRGKDYCDNTVDKVELIEELTEPVKEERFLDRKELEKIFEACRKNRRYDTVTRFLFMTGMRQEEMFALHENDFKVMENGTVEISIDETVVEEEGHEYKIVPKTKTKRSKRTVVIPYEVYEMVMDYYKECLNNETEFQSYLRSLNGTDGYIFVNKDMKPINKRTFERNFGDYLKRNGVKDIKATLHMFRHSYASFQAEKISFEKVAMMLGDSVKTVMDNYYSVSEKSKEDISNNVSDLWESFDF